MLVESSTLQKILRFFDSSESGDAEAKSLPGWLHGICWRRSTLPRCFPEHFSLDQAPRGPWGTRNSAASHASTAHIKDAEIRGFAFQVMFYFWSLLKGLPFFFANFFIFGLTQTPFGTFGDFINFVRFLKHIQGFFLWILPWATSGGKSEVQQNSSASLAKHERIRTDASFVQWLQVFSVKWSSPKSIEKLVSFVWWYV